MLGAARATDTHPDMHRDPRSSATRLRSSVTTRLLLATPLGGARLHSGVLQKHRRPSPGRDSDMHTRVTGMFRLSLVEHVRIVCSCPANTHVHGVSRRHAVNVLYIRRFERYRFRAGNTAFPLVLLLGQKVLLFCNFQKQPKFPVKSLYLLHAKPFYAHFTSEVISHFLSRVFTATEDGTSKWRP